MMGVCKAEGTLEQGNGSGPVTIDLAAASKSHPLEMGVTDTVDCRVTVHGSSTA